MEKLSDTERIDDLQRGGFRIIQDSRLFRFGTDAVLLTHFARIRKGDRIVDLGSGNGVIPLLLCSLYDDISITGIELMRKNAELFRRNVVLNNVSDRITVIEDDIKNVPSLFVPGETETVITNPPYMKCEGALKNESPERAAARHEIYIDLDGIISAASYLLKFGGRFFMVHRPERLAEIFVLMKKYSIEPKRLRFVQSSAEKEPSMILVEGAKGGKEGLKIMPVFIIHDKSGELTEEYKKIYYG